MYLLCFVSFLLTGAVELEEEPSWESIDNDYSTGGVLADVDADGDLDLVTGNGNDMARNHNKVYYSQADMFEQVASWSSSDIACNGHVSLGDADADGDLDLAVAGFAYASGWVSDPSRVYVNDGGTFASNPVWLGADTFHAFSCDWGDADADGDLDLAIAAGNEYDDRRQKVVIFENIDGMLSAEPAWESEDTDYNMDVCWVDVDGDGDLDLAAAGYKTNRIYFTEDGILGTEAGWVSADSHHTVQVAFADFDADGDMDMAAADNNQIGDDASRVRLYKNHEGVLEELPSWESKLWMYQSCVAFSDVDSDGDLDLAAGGWWEPVCVYENKEGSFDALPSWSWQPSDPYDLVCEQVIWGEVDNDNWQETTEEFGPISTGDAVYPSHFPALDIEEVRINDSAAEPGDYLWNPADGWLQINKRGSVEVSYRYSQFPDLVVTSWVPDRGNFAFLNTAKDTFDAVAAEPYEGSPIRLERSLLFKGEPLRITGFENNVQVELSIYDAVGRRIDAHKLRTAGSASGIRVQTEGLGSGVYFLEVLTFGNRQVLRFQLL